MRKFDYHRLLQRLNTGKVADASARLYECKGRLDALKSLRGRELGLLEETARFDNVDASMHIDGLYLDAARLHDLLAGAEPANDLESQAVGYSDALGLVSREFDDLDVSTTTVLTLYEKLYAHRALGRKSRYRKKDYIYVEIDGHPQATPVSPITAFETPLVLGGACDSLSEELASDGANPLILSGAFTLDFLCIRPFDEGNGRISRAFASLLLAKAGFDVWRYVSVDRFIEATAMEYYDALNACVERWDRGANDYTPYIHYWLTVLEQAYRRLFQRIDELSGDVGGKTGRVRLFVENARGPITKRMIREGLPDVSEATVEAALGNMVKEGLIEKVGSGRSTSYRFVGGSKA